MTFHDFYDKWEACIYFNVFSKYVFPSEHCLLIFHEIKCFLSISKYKHCKRAFVVFIKKKLAFLIGLEPESSGIECNFLIIKYNIFHSMDSRTRKLIIQLIFFFQHTRAIAR
jgi:hypothetical protein